MAIKTYKPTSKSRRHMSVVAYKGVTTTSNPEKSLTSGHHRKVGRNAFGRVTTRHKGAGVKRLWREIDFKYDKIGVPYKIASVEYDPNRSAHIALVLYIDGERRYIIAPKGLRVGDEVVSGENV